MSNTFTLRDTFNDRNVSNHRTLRAAIEAERKLLRAVRRHNGSGSYLPTQILCNGEPLTLEMLDEATDIRINLEAGR
jgi:hypothetical protein